MHFTQSELAGLEQALAGVQGGLNELGMEHMAEILDRMPTVVYVKDREGKYLFVNRQYEQLTRTTRKQVIGGTDYDVFSKPMADAYRANDLQVFEQGTALEFEEEAELADGVHSFIELKFPLRDADGVVYAICGVGTDVTERLRASERLRQIDKAEAVRRLVNDLSHELNNPLQSLTNVFYLMRQDPAEAGRFLELADDAIHRVRDISKQLAEQARPRD